MLLKNNPQKKTMVNSVIGVQNSVMCSEVPLKNISLLVEEPTSREGPQKLLSIMWHEPSDYCLST